MMYKIHYSVGGIYTEIWAKNLKDARLKKAQIVAYHCHNDLYFDLYPEILFNGKSVEN